MMSKMSVNALIQQATTLAKNNESVRIALENLEEIIQQEQSAENVNNPERVFGYYEVGISIIVIVGILLTGILIIFP